MSKKTKKGERLERVINGLSWYKLLQLLLFILLVVVPVGCGSSSSSPTPYTPTPQTAWEEDIDFLIEKLRTVHPDVLHNMSESELSERANALFTATSILTDDEIFVEILKFLSAIGAERDGHLALSFFVSTGYNISPLKFYQFEDGVYVIQASPDYHHLVGAKLLGIEGKDLIDVNYLIDDILTRDNQSSLETNRNLVYLVPQILQSLGIIQAGDAIDYELVLTGEVSSQNINVQPVSASAFNLDASINLPRDSSHFYLANSEAFWMRYFEDDNVVYMKMNQVSNTSDTSTLAALANSVLTVTQNNMVNNVILDLRQNNGGNNQLVSDIVDFLQAPSINIPGKLLVFTDRQTFSAAGNLVYEIKHQTEALVMGVPPGGVGNQYGDTKRFDLPHSKLAVFIPSRYWTFGNQDEPVLLLEMDNIVDMTSFDYFNGHDELLSQFVTELH